MKKLVFMFVVLGVMAFSVMPNAQNVVVKESLEVLKALELKETDRFEGNKDAPITIVEYASMTCGHCADFHNKHYKEVKKQLVDTGRVKFVFRELPWDNRALAVSVVARCAPAKDHSKFLSAFFSTHANWARSNDFMSSIKQIARLGGMSADDVDACLKNPEINDVVRKSRKEATDVLGIKGTPAFFINGHRFSGLLTAGEIVDYVEQLETKLK